MSFMKDNIFGLLDSFNGNAFAEAEQAMRDVGNLDLDKRVQFMADVKTRYKGNSRAQKMIDDVKYTRLLAIRLDIIFDELIDPKTTLFSPAERAQLAPVAQELKKNAELPDDERVPHLARLKAQYHTTRQQEFIDKTASYLPDHIIYAEAANQQTDLFTSGQIKRYRVNAIKAVFDLKDDEQAAAFDKLKSQYKGDVDSVALIDRFKFQSQQPKVAIYNELIASKAGLF